MGTSENLRQWSTTAASNSSADTGINWAEGQAASSVNDSARSMMAAMAKWMSDNQGALTTAGGTTAYTATSATGYTALANGLTVVAKFNAANTGAPTLNLDSLGAKAIRKFINGAETALVANDLVTNNHYLLVYDTAVNAAAGGWIVMNPSADFTVGGGLSLTAGVLNSKMVLLVSGNTSGATVDVALTSGYSVYKLLITQFRPATADQNLLFRLSFDNAVSYKSGATDYNSQLMSAPSSPTSGNVGYNYASANAGYLTTIQNNVLGYCTGDYTINPLNGAYPVITGQFMSNSNAGIIYGGSTYAACTSGGGVAATNIRFLCASGNITTIAYQLYGIV